MVKELPLILLLCSLFAGPAQASSSLEASHELRVINGPDGQVVEGMFDFSWWAGGDPTHLRTSCYGDDGVRLIAGEDPLVEAIFAPAIRNCSNCHCNAGSSGCTGCAADHTPAVYYDQNCNGLGCNLSYCKEVPGNCCTICQPESWCYNCGRPGYCSK